jgi:hypothetical protein
MGDSRDQNEGPSTHLRQPILVLPFVAFVAFPFKFFFSSAFLQIRVASEAGF